MNPRGVPHLETREEIVKDQEESHRCPGVPHRIPACAMVKPEAANASLSTAGVPHSVYHSANLWINMQLVSNLIYLGFLICVSQLPYQNMRIIFYIF